MKTLVLISDSFPYGSVTENSFISPEIEPLSKKFDRVIIAPRVKRGENLDIDTATLPGNVEISDSLIIKASSWKKLRAIPSMLRPIIYDLHHTSGSLREIIAYSSYVDICRRDIEKMIADYSLDLNDTLFYTFWFDFTTAALAEINDAKIVTRTHGHDLYEDKYFISSWWRKRTFPKTLAVFTVSEAGLKYLSELYPDHKEKILLSRLGTVKTHSEIHPDDSGLQVSDDTTGTHQLKLLGISRLSPEKGMIRQFRMLQEYAVSFPDRTIEYTHIGDGPLMPQIKEIIKRNPTNLKINLTGALHNSKVHAILQSGHFDACLLLSYSEGGCPIALCEAMSYGIPVLATPVGGISEMLNSGGGILLGNSPTVSSLAAALDNIHENKKRLRAEAYDIWKENFSAINLREKFADYIAELY